MKPAQEPSERTASCRTFFRTCNPKAFPETRGTQERPREPPLDTQLLLQEALEQLQTSPKRPGTLWQADSKNILRTAVEHFSTYRNIVNTTRKWVELRQNPPQRVCENENHLKNRLQVLRPDWAWWWTGEPVGCGTQMELLFCGRAAAVRRAGLRAPRGGRSRYCSISVCAALNCFYRSWLKTDNNTTTQNRL